MTVDQDTVRELATAEDIHTSHLWLRPVTTTDISILVRLWTNAEVRRYLGGPIEQAAASQRVAHHIDRPGSFCVTHRASGEVLGLCSLGRYRTGDIEVSYQFLPEHWGHGFAREAIAAVIAWGFTYLDVGRIVAVTQTANMRSRRLLEVIGLFTIDTFREHGELQAMYAINRPSR